MADKITYGISNVHYAIKTVSAAGAISYGKPVALPGAYEISMPPEGETVQVYADNITYVKILVNSGYDGDLGLYTIPESFWVDVLGQTKDTDQTLIESAGDIAKEFALLGEMQTDTEQTKRFVFWNCSAGRPDVESSTREDSIEANQFSVPITATAVEGTEFVKGTILGDSTVEAWANWFTEVRAPELKGTDGE